MTESARHRILASERRRIAIDVLDDHTVPVDLEELAVAVAEREDGVDPTDDESITQMKTMLHHVHLPLVNEAGLISYDLHELRVTSCRSLSDVFCADGYAHET